MKKIISILMAAVMLISCFSVMSFAAVNDALVKVEFKVKEVVDNVVTFEVWLEQTTDEIGLLGAFDAMYVGFDSRVFEPVDALTDATALEWPDQTTVITEGYPCDNNFFKTTISWIMLNPVDIACNDADRAKGWDSVLWIGMTPDSCDDDYSTPAACFAFKLKLKADAPADGCYKVGIVDSSITGEVQTLLNEEVGAIGGSAADLGFSTSNVFELVDATVEKPAAGPVVAKNAAQAKFTYDATTDNGVADTFKLRIKSVITDADWDAYFANSTDDAATTNKITSVGMVAFPASEEFNADSANAAIAAIGDKEYAGAYKAASTNYIQKTDDTSDAYFGAIINIKHSTCTSNLKYIGYVQYLDATGTAQTIFYEAAFEAGVSGAQYDALVNAYKTQFPA